ncbi:MAG: tetratricopeptide repeat protein [Gammaproteobacteria bacterium]|jgi:predicted Zn-dependent protease
MSRWMGWRCWLWLAWVLVLSACSSVPPEHDNLPQRPGPSMPQTPSSAQGNPAVVALLHTAQDQQLAGHHEQAASALERALRLEPRNAMLWHRLAQVRLSQGQWGNAIDFAAKSNSLAGGQRDIQASNWLVIAQAKERQGDRDGARAARAHVDLDGASQPEDSAR